MAAKTKALGKKARLRPALCAGSRLKLRRRCPGPGGDPKDPLLPGAGSSGQVPAPRPPVPAYHSKNYSTGRGGGQ